MYQRIIGASCSPVVGDITSGYKPPRRSLFIHRETVNIEAREVIEDGYLWRKYNKGAQSPEAG